MQGQRRLRLAGRPLMADDTAPTPEWTAVNHMNEGPALEPLPALDRFLAGVERRAFVMARLATGNVDDAHDIVQDAMLTLVRSYASRGEQEWGPLFHTILQSRITDWHRRSKVRNRLRVWFGKRDEDDEDDPLQNIADGRSPDPPTQLKDKQAMAALESAIRKLPTRQQQAFLLRVWEGLDVAQTARAMNCSEGSVKTHYSRAVHALREQLEDHL
jgi:RNA polymerase sigma-70 factor (ECF subfamily)